MKLKIFFVFAIIIFALVGAFVFFASFKKPVKEQQLAPAPTVSPQVANMKLISQAFSHNQPIPEKYTCDGENVSPPLSISEIPKDTQSLALIVDDPDAPGRTFVHWVVWSIDPSIQEIAEGSIPQGAQEGASDFGQKGYGGPCPPSGTHRYFFKLYALDSQFDLAGDTRKADLERVMAGHILAQAELIGLYSRQK